MSFLCANVAPIVVAAVASVIVWVYGGIRGEFLPAFVPWLVAFLIEVIVCFPQRHRGESAYEARERVWYAMKRDPLVWVSLGLLLLLAVPFVNNGLCPLCDAAAISQGIDPEPPVPFVPFCVDRRAHLNVFLWFAIAMPVLVAVRHSLTRRGKRLVLQLVVWNGFAVAILGFVQNALGAPGPLWWRLGEGQSSVAFFATFGYPNMGGDYFAVLFGVAVALWRDRSEQMRKERQDRDVSKTAGPERNRFWQTHFFLIPAAVFFFAALNTLSRAAILLASVTAVVYLAHALASAAARMRKVKRVLFGIWSLALVGLILFLATLFMPEKIQKEMHTVDTVETLDRVTGKGQYHARVATALWKDHLLFGCGGWGYAHLCRLKMTPEELKNIQMSGGANVHNDYLQFLAEHGLVGFGAMVALVVLLVWPVVGDWKRLVRQTRFTKRNGIAAPVQIFALPAPAFILLVAASVTVIHAFGDCPLRSPAVLTLFYIVLAAVPGFIAKSADSH